VAGAANAAEIYNKNGNKLDFYGKMVGEHILTNTDRDNSDNNSRDTTYARFGVKGETQINSDLTGYGRFEYNIKADKPEGEQGSATRLAFAGLKFANYGSFDYGVTMVWFMTRRVTPICWSNGAAMAWWRPTTL
jgi:outer membrane pore protein F